MAENIRSYYKKVYFQLFPVPFDDLLLKEKEKKEKTDERFLMAKELEQAKKKKAEELFAKSLKQE